jgi:hypothetical protein
MSNQSKHVGNYKTTTPLREIRVDVIYSKGRGYRLYVSPITRDEKDPDIYSTVLTSTASAMIEPATRFSQKKLAELSAAAPGSALLRTLVDKVLAEQGLALEPGTLV